VWAGVPADDVEAALEERQLVLVDMNFVVVVGQDRGLLEAVSAAEKLTLDVERSAF